MFAGQMKLKLQLGSVLLAALVLLRRSNKLFRPLRCKGFSATILGITKCVPRFAGRNKNDLSLAFREALPLGRTLETGLYYSDLFVRHEFGGDGGSGPTQVSEQTPNFARSYFYH